MHFEQMAAEYATARPPYPSRLYQVLEAEGVIGPETRVLEIGAGAGLATRELVRSGSSVVAVEPGPDLARLLVQEVPRASVLVTTLERADLTVGGFDSAVAATSMHWVDLLIALPKLHAALSPSGRLAVWRHRFGDDGFDTAFRGRVEQIVAARAGRRPAPELRTDDRPSMDELSAGGWFQPVRSERWRWSIDMDADKVRRLFRTFSDWDDAEVSAVGRAVDDLGGLVTEHYQTVLHILRRSCPSA